MRALVGMLGFAAVTLSGAAAVVYLDGARGVHVESARRGIEMHTTKAALVAAGRSEGALPEAPSTAAPAVVLSSAPSASTPNLTRGPHHADRQQPTSTTAGAAPPTSAKAAPAAATAKAWNPFDERN